MREICQSGSEGGASQTNGTFLPLSHVGGHRLLINRFHSVVKQCFCGWRSPSGKVASYSLRSHGLECVCHPAVLPQRAMP